MIKDYLKEIQNLEFFENDQGFIAYRIYETNLHIAHMYVAPEFRLMKVATALADSLIEEAKEVGCKTITADVEPSNNNATASTIFILSYGLQIISASEDEILFYKEL